MMNYLMLIMIPYCMIYHQIVSLGKITSRMIEKNKAITLLQSLKQKKVYQFSS